MQMMGRIALKDRDVYAPPASKWGFDAKTRRALVQKYKLPRTIAIRNTLFFTTLAP